MKIFFYILFFTLFLTSFFLIESDYRYYLFAIWSVFLLISSFFSNRNKTEKSIYLSILLTVLFGFSLFFSKQPALSLEKLTLYVVSLAIFIFFKLFKGKLFDRNVFFYYLSLISIILNFFVLFFTFFKLPSNFFPGMNLLIRNYGHNHYVSYLLLMIPIFWWLFLSVLEKSIFLKKEVKFFSFLLLLSSYLLVIFSLGRLALFISLLQLVVIYLVNKRSFFNSIQNELGKTLIRIFMILFLSIGLFFLFLSIPISSEKKFICDSFFSGKEICKSFTKNDRFAYWQKAILIFKNNIPFGYGLKTFAFASKHFPSEDYKITSYAHNIFLNNLAESGLISGTFFIIFVILLFYEGFLTIKKNKNSKENNLNIFLMISALSSFLNAMLDFDWNFFIIFSLTLIFLALISDQNSDSNANSNKLGNLRIYFFIIVIYSCFLAFYSFSAEVLQSRRRIDLIVKYFPYSDSKIRKLVSDKRLNKDEYELLFPIYKKDPGFLYEFSKVKDIDRDKNVDLQILLSEIDPLFFSKNISFDNLDYKSSKILAEKYIDILKKFDFLDNYFFIDYWQQRNSAAQFILFGNQAYQNNDMEYAVNFYEMAIVLNQNVMDDIEIYFLNDKDFSRAVDFLNLFKETNPRLFGKNFYAYIRKYENVLDYLFRTNQLENFFSLADALFINEPNSSWFVFNTIIKSSSTSTDKQKLEEVRNHFASDIKEQIFFWPEIDSN